MRACYNNLSTPTNTTVRPEAPTQRSDQKHQQSIFEEKIMLMRMICRKYHGIRCSNKAITTVAVILAVFILSGTYYLSFGHSNVGVSSNANVSFAPHTTSIPVLSTVPNVVDQRESGPLIIYERCQGIPDAPDGMKWPEEEYLHDQPASSILDIPDPVTSRVWLDGDGSVKVGDTVKIHIHLYNGRNERRTQGGDLVRVWLREDRKGAKSAAHVTDNKDGSYTANVTVFWEGQPEVHAAIISPREVIAIAFKRRYTCPPVLMNTAIFQHPLESDVREETPCNYDNFIPGYSDVCNLTNENYGRPWYCGKPRYKRLVCEDWILSSDVNLWNAGHEQTILSSVEQQLMNLKYTARKIQTNITLTVTEDNDGRRMIIPSMDCSLVDKAQTWEYVSPTGYLYNHKWINRQCKTNPIQDTGKLKSCLENTTVILIGDSTTRQMFEQIEKLIPCEWMTDTWSVNGKHRPVHCANAEMNYGLMWKSHSLPYSTNSSHRAYFKSPQAYLNEIQGARRFVIVIHLFAHFLNFQFHVFYETLKELRKSIISLLDRNLDVSIVIKGPHAYSFSERSDHVMWMPDAYANVYQKFIYDEFKDLRDKIVYLECMDITISTEQWFIHPEDFVVDTFVEHVFSFTCD